LLATSRHILLNWSVVRGNNVLCWPILSWRLLRRLLLRSWLLVDWLGVGSGLALGNWLIRGSWLGLRGGGWLLG
jgi:hypothetical protein